MIDETEKCILERIDAHREQIIAFAEDIAAHPGKGLKKYGRPEKRQSF